MEAIEVLIHNETLNLKGTAGLLRTVSPHGFYEINLKFGSNVHRVHLPIHSTVLIYKDPEPVVETVEIER
jgi:hypothetical protein